MTASPDPARLRVIFAGSGEFGLDSLARLIEHGHTIVQVISQPDRPAGRGRQTTPTPISRYSLEHDLPLIRTNDINSLDLADCDVMVVIAFGQKLAPHCVDRPRLGSVNLHASRLPRWRGAAPINWTIIAGDALAGNSIIRIARRMDSGDILAQSALPVGELETAGELHDRLSKDGADLLERTLDGLAAGVIRETAQNEQEVTTAPKLNRDSGRLDWAQSPVSLAARIRGLYPWPGCRVSILDAAGNPSARATLVRARPGNADGSRWRAGEITTYGQVCVGDGRAGLEILELQPDGRRPMSIADYRRGHPWLPGMRLQSPVAAGPPTH